MLFSPLLCQSDLRLYETYTYTSEIVGDDWCSGGNFLTLTLTLTLLNDFASEF